MVEKQECSCNCNKEPTMASSLAHDEMPVEGLHYSDGIHALINRSDGLKYDGVKYNADYHPIKTSKISDIIIKELDYGYLVKIGCQTLGIESQTKLNQWLQEYIADPDKITKRWNDGYYHFAKAEDIHIGIISLSSNDFLEWSDQFPYKSKSRDAMKQFTVHVIDDKKECINIIYHRISTISDCKGHAFHRILETKRAKQNKDFEVILEVIKPCLYSQDNDKV